MSRRESSKGDAVRLKKKTTTDNLKLLYKMYYSSKPRIKPPTSIEMREFAFQLFDMETYIRHISFKNYKELLEFISEKNPRHAYYSVGLYSIPDAKSMEEKDWRGSELLFDIDSDNISGCISIRTGEDPLIDDSCLMMGFNLAKKLSLMLKRDLDIDSTIYFTGNRGFHVIAYCDYCLSLGKDEREEIARYILGEGLDLTKVIFMTWHKRSIKGEILLSPEDPGWRGWISLELAKRGFSKGLKDLSIIQTVINDIRIPIDKQVTRDPTRLSRIRGSLNGKASLLVVDIEGDSFNPDFSLSPFRGEVTIRARVEIPDIKLLGVKINLREGEEATLEAPVGLVLASKGYVEIEEGEVVVE